MTSQQAPPATTDRIAIVGMAGRFPGAGSVEAFWERTVAGEVDVRHVPDRRAGFVAARGVVDGGDRFDAEFFRVPEREATLLDPQQRMLLECAQHALEDAAIDPAQNDDTVSAYVACGPVTSIHAPAESLSEQYERDLASAPDFAATRISYRLGLRGESMTVQTGCSSSLVAVHLACQSLLAGQSDIALAGGASLVADQEQGYAIEPGMIASPTGGCRPFDVSADGTVPASGAGIVVLRRLEDALRAGDRIYAVVLSSAINNDGATKVGFMSPSAAGQAEVIATAHSVARVPAGSIGYVETHGTATPLGDEIEIEGLRRAFALDSGRSMPCSLGSVKANVGHMDRAAGIAGLIRAALAVHREVIPPMAGFTAPNPGLGLDAAGFVVPTSPRRWPDGVPRRAGVSGFGVGGTNVHVVLEEASAAPPCADAPASPVVLPISASSQAALVRSARDLAAVIEGDDLDLRSVARTLLLGRRLLGHRGFVVGATGAAAAKSLRSVTAGIPAGSRPDVVFAFPGQGEEVVDGLPGIYACEPEYRRAIDDCAETIAAHAGFDIRDILYGDAGHAERVARFCDMGLFQPALFAVEWALAALWSSWGVRATAVIGHSIGELVAATYAGVFRLEDALALVVARGRAMQATDPGAVLSVALAPGVLAPMLEPETHIASINGRELVAVAGAPDAVARLEARLTAEGWSARRLAIWRAAHGPAMHGAAASLREVARSFGLSAPTIPIVANVTGDWAGDTVATPEYWGTHVSTPVRFGESLARIAARPNVVILEIGPTNALGRLMAHEVGSSVRAVISTCDRASGDADEQGSLLHAVGALWACGVPVPPRAMRIDVTAPKVAVPRTGFDHTRRWVAPSPRRAEPAARGGKQADPATWLYEPVWTPWQAEPGTGPPTGPVVWIGDGAPWRDAFLVAAGAAHLTASARLEPDASGMVAGAVRDVVWWIADADDDVLERLAGEARRLSAVPGTRFWVVAGDAAADAHDVPRAALARALAVVLPQECPGIRVHSVEIRTGSAESVGQGLIDLMGSPAPPADVQITDSALLAVSLQRAWPHWRSRPMRENGHYLLTGGAGRVGRALAVALAREAEGARITMLGRSDAAAIRGDLEHIEETLSPLGATCRYVRADVTDRAALARCFDSLRAGHGRIDGVIHAAAFTDRTAFPLLTSADARALAEISSAKVLGAHGIAAALREDDADFVILCSSLSTVLGGVGFGPYVAANAGLDLFARSRHEAGDHRWVSVAWDAWTEAGQRSESGPALYALNDADGQEVVRRALAARSGRIVVSTGDIDARITEVADQLGLAARDGPRQASATRSPEDAVSVVHATLRDVLGAVPSDIHRDLRDDGVESLTILQIVSRLRAALGADIPLADAMRALTVAGLERVAGRALEPTGRGPAARQSLVVRSVAAAGHHPTSSTQRRWLDLMPEGYGGIDIAISVTGDVTTEELAAAVRRVVDRHSGLRTRFERRGDGWVQVPTSTVNVTTVALPSVPLPDRLARLSAVVGDLAATWFDVTSEPPFTVTIAQLDAGHHVMALHAHHVVFDGWSSSLFLRDVVRAVRGDLGPEPPQYADYAVAQAEYLRSTAIVPVREYWTDHFKGAPAPTRVPPDVFEGDGDDRGEVLPFEVPGAVLGGLRTQARRLETTPFTVMMAGYAILIHELTGDLDIVLGTTAAGRPIPQTEEIVGVFVNPLPIRFRISPEISIGRFLGSVDTVLTGFHENGHYPLEDLTRHVPPFVGLGLNDAFHCYLLYQNYWRPEPGALSFQPLALEQAPHHRLMREFEIVLEERNGGLAGELWYRPSRFTRERAAHWRARYCDILESLASPALDLDRCLRSMIEPTHPHE